MNISGLIFFLGYTIVFMAALFSVIWLERVRRRTRSPFPEDLKLLRMPGEHLWSRVIKADESGPQLWLVMTVIPLLIGSVALHVVGHYFASSIVAGLVGASMLFVFSMLCCVRWCQLQLQRRDNDYLGFFGERYVAERLDPLKSDGWFIFHDVQCEGATGKFNLDHVAVGPCGVWVIETKTRRKGRARHGLKDHEVTFDGTQIIWPWGEEMQSVSQAVNHAHWLREWIHKRTGKNVEVNAALTFPGYYVTERKLGAVRVANPNLLPQLLIGRGKIVLTAEEIDLIRRQIEDRCRDVKY